MVASSSSTAPSSSNATPLSPTYYGMLSTPLDATLLLAACDIPWPNPSQYGNQASSASSSVPTSSSSPPIPPPRRISRRLLELEKNNLIKSGNVFVFSEDETQMRRWTDGKVWSASRVNGSFLTYRELEVKKRAPTTNPETQQVSLSTQNVYREDGLVKQSYSITTASGRKLHIISYYTRKDALFGKLMRVSKDPRFVGEGGGEWGLRIDEKEYRTDLSTLAEGSDVVFNTSTSSDYPDSSIDEETASTVEDAHDQVRLTPVIERQRHPSESGGDRERRIRALPVLSPREFRPSHHDHIQRGSPPDASSTSRSISDHPYQQQPQYASCSDRRHPPSSWAQSSSTHPPSNIYTDSSRVHGRSFLTSEQSAPTWSSSSSSTFSSGMPAPAPVGAEAGYRSRTELQYPDSMDMDSDPSSGIRERGTTITQRPRSLAIPSLSSPDTAALRNDSVDSKEARESSHRSDSGSSLLRPRPFRTFSSSSHHSQPSSSRFGQDPGPKLHRAHSLKDRPTLSADSVRSKRRADIEGDYLIARSDDVPSRHSIHRDNDASSSRSPSPLFRGQRQLKALKTSSGDSYGSNSLASSSITLNSGGTGAFSTASLRSLSSFATTPYSSTNQSTTSLSPGSSHKSVPQHRHQSQSFSFRAGSEERWRTIRERDSSDPGSEQGSVTSHWGMGAVGGANGGLAHLMERNRSPTLSVGSLNDLPTSAPPNASSSHLDVTNSLFRLKTMSASEKEFPPFNRALSSTASPQEHSLASPNNYQKSASGVQQQVYSRSPTSSLAVSSLRENDLPSFADSPANSSTFQQHNSSSEDSPSFFRNRPGIPPYSVPGRSASDNDVLNRLDTRL